LNATGLDTHKFSITHGIRSRTDEKDPGDKSPEGVSKRLFGPKADHSKIHSFHGVAELIKKHIPKDQHQAIYNKFKDSTSKLKMTGTDNAVSHLRKTLNVSDSMNEENDGVNHVHMSFLGAAPFPHMGHHMDVVGSMKSAPSGRKFIGLSGKSDAFSDKEREEIANRQSGGDAEFKVENSPGHAIARAYNSISSSKGKKVLHLHFGHDRKSFAENLKRSVENGKMKELGSNRFDEVHIHYPKDENRSHGFSGTKMRKAASAGDIKTFHSHLGPSFSKKEAISLMHRVKKGIDSGKIPLLREETNKLFPFKYFSLNEKVLNIGFNPDHEEHREKHRKEIHDLLRKSYAGIGGYSGLGSGSKEESDAIHKDISNTNIKAVKRDGKVVAARLYKDSHGRKSVALGSDGSDQGRKDAAMLMKDDAKLKDRHSWGEYSGAVRHILKNKLGSPVIHPSKVEKLISKKITPVDDESYERPIGGHMHNKSVLGYPKNAD
jgi:hypothetical protein